LVCIKIIQHYNYVLIKPEREKNYYNTLIQW
jgi:hypothetical protein